MTQYTVKPGDSPASVAGAMYGDQRRYIDLINANGGNWHPGDVIDIPDITGTPSPVITQAQFNAAPTGYKNGQPQYRGQTNTPATPTFSKPNVPAFGANSAGMYDQRTGSNAGTSPWSVQPTLPRPTTYGPNSAGTYDSRSNRNAGVTGAGSGAMPSHQGAGYNANPALWPPLPGASGPNTGVGSGGLKVPPSVTAPNPYAGNGPNPMLYTTTNPAAGDPLMNAIKNTIGGMSKPGAAQTQGFQTPQTSGTYQPVGPGGFPLPHSTIPPEMANIAWAARYSTAAIYAYGGLYGPAWRGNRQTLPVVIYPTVANEIPIPAGYKDTPSFMAALGYVVDASGNYVRKDPMVSQGYGGGNYGTATSLPSSGGGYGGYGYGGYSYPPASGGHTPDLGPAAGGLVSWRITA